MSNNQEPMTNFQTNFNTEIPMKSGVKGIRLFPHWSLAFGACLKIGS